MKLRSFFYVYVAILLLMIFGGLSACVKNKKPVCQDDIGRLTDNYGNPLYHGEYPANARPYFNPSNSNEFIFLNLRSEDLSLSLLNLVKYNLSTKEHTLLIQKYIGGIPRWSRKGWILFSSWNFDLRQKEYWKIKDNGDSLTFLLSLFPYGGDPDWNKAGDKFICSGFVEEGYNFIPCYFIIDEHGAVLDTFYDNTLESPLSWQHDSLVVFTREYGLYAGNPYEGVFNRIYPLDPAQNPNPEYGYSPQGAEWIDDHRVVWTYRDGILITDVYSGETSVLKETCVADRYRNPTYAPQIKKLAFDHAVIERSKEGEGGVIFTAIHFMNLDGSCEEEFEFDLE